MERLLAAILAADIVGYSRLMGCDVHFISGLMAHRMPFIVAELASGSQDRASRTRGQPGRVRLHPLAFVYSADSYSTGSNSS